MGWSLNDKRETRQRIFRMVQYKLTYFDARGNAEVSRILFAAAGVKYEDCRLSWENWQKVKCDAPFGQLPTLEVDGKKYAQSLAINRYLSKKFGFYGTNDEEAMQIDAIVDTFGDLKQEIYKALMEKDEAKKKELHDKLMKETVPAKFACIEKAIQGKDGYCVGKGPSLADVVLFAVGDMMRLHGKKNGMGDGTGVPGPMKSFAKMSALFTKVEGNPKMKAWLEKRPVTDN